MKNDRTIRLVVDTEKEQWNSIVAHPLQTWEWGEFRQRMGVEVERLGVYEKNKLTEGWQLTFHRIPFLPLCIGYFPKGPRPTVEMLNAIRKVGREKHAIAIQLEPDITMEEPLDINNFPALKESHRPLFTKYTFVLDLTKPEEELLRGMHPKTRYNIRVAQRKGVVVREDSSPSAFAKYIQLSRETTRRQHFYAHNTAYHTLMWKILHKSGLTHLFTATYQNTVVSAWIIFVWKDTVYYPYGASSRQHKDVMAPNLLLWEIVRWAKKRGLYYFDLWGAMGPNPDTKDPWYGFHRFKEGYNPALVEYVGSYELVIRPLLYFVYTCIDSARWFFLKHKLF